MAWPRPICTNIIAPECFRQVRGKASLSHKLSRSIRERPHNSDNTYNDRWHRHCGLGRQAGGPFLESHFLCLPDKWGKHADLARSRTHRHSMRRRTPRKRTGQQYISVGKIWMHKRRFARLQLDKGNCQDLFGISCRTIHVPHVHLSNLVNHGRGPKDAYKPYKRIQPFASIPRCLYADLPWPQP